MRGRPNHILHGRLMTSPRLSSKERAALRSQAHKLDPVQHVGASGVTPAVLQSITEAFNTRELIKIRVLDAAPESAYESADRIANQLDNVHVIQTIGRTVVLYRPFPED
jgi:RNA-binding protein